MGQSWKFIVAPRPDHGQQSWSWVLCQEGRGVLRSADGFQTFLNCVNDARLRGFGVSDPFDIIRERRKDTRDLAAAPRPVTARAARHG